VIFSNIYLNNGNGSAINGIIGNGVELIINKCEFILCESKGNDNNFGCGGAINIILSGNGKFNISGDESSPTKFDRCSVPSSTVESLGYGGGICLYIEDDGSDFSFNGKIEFINCKATHGKNIYINSKTLTNSITSTTFNYNYSLISGEELIGNDNRDLSSDIQLKKFLCPLYTFSESFFLIFYLFIYLIFYF
jgi:hypothetical protein